MLKIKLNLLFAFLLATTKLISQAVTTYLPPAGYNLTQIRNCNTICTNSNGTEAYIGYRDIGLQKLETSTQTWTAFDTTNSGIASNNVTVVKFNSLNQLWIGTRNAGLSNFTGTTWTNYSTQNSALCNDTVLSLLPMATGLWVGTQNGLSFFNGASFTNYTTSNSGIVGNKINCLETDGSGNLYVGTSSGFSIFNGTVWSNTSISNSSLMSDTVTKIQYINANACWILTARGLAKLQQGNLEVFSDSICSPQQYEYRFRYILHIIKKGNNLFAYDGYERKLKSITPNDSISIFLDTINPGAMNTLFSRASMHVDATGKLWTAYTPSNFNNPTLTSFDENLSIGFYSPPIIPFKKSYEELDYNEVRTTLNNNGAMYWDYDNGKYEVPKCSGKNTLFAGALWLGAYDQNGVLHASAMTYRQSNQTDFWQGPLDTLTGNTDTATVNLYNDVWKLNAETIDAFKINFLNGNVTNGTYPVPYDILTYPAVGSGNFTRNMAPYFDYNGDGNYNPYDGDYPLIKGNQQLYWIYNDNDTMHTTTNVLPLKVEIHSTAYSYYCPGLSVNDANGVLNYTTFYNFEIYNRSSNNYDSAFVGVWIDVDLGDYNDDYVGCDSALNIGFGFNGDNDDGSGTFAGYGLNPPIINCQILKGPIADINDGKDNDHDGTIDEAGETNMMNTFMTYENYNLVPTGNPDVGDDYYQYMSGSWCDGVPFSYGGNGYNPGSTNYTPFMFSGTPYTPTGWSMGGISINPQDQRLLLASGPFSLAPGQMKSLDYAIVFTWDSTAANGFNTSIAKNIIANQKIKQWFDAGVLGDCNLLSLNNPTVTQNKFYVYPNPANNTINLIANFAGTEPLLYTIRDLTGRIIDQNYFTHSTSVSVKNFDPAVYLISVSNSKIFATQKFVKQ